MINVARTIELTRARRAGAHSAWPRSNDVSSSFGAGRPAELSSERHGRASRKGQASFSRLASCPHFAKVSRSLPLNCRSPLKEASQRAAILSRPASQPAYSLDRLSGGEFHAARASELAIIWRRAKDISYPPPRAKSNSGSLSGLLVFITS